MNRLAILSGKQNVSTSKKLETAQAAVQMPAARVATASDKLATASHGEVKRIYAIGKVKGNPSLLTAKHDRSGRYVLNRKNSSPITENTTNRAENKVYAATLREAADLLESGEFLINVVTKNGVRELHSYRYVVVERVQQSTF